MTLKKEDYYVTPVSINWKVLLRLFVCLSACSLHPLTPPLLHSCQGNHEVAAGRQIEARTIIHSISCGWKREEDAVAEWLKK